MLSVLAVNVCLNLQIFENTVKNFQIYRFPHDSRVCRLSQSVEQVIN